jgi:amino acid adenylation domain-containing protein
LRPESKLEGPEIRNLNNESKEHRGVLDFVFAPALRAQLSAVAAEEGLEIFAFVLAIFQELLRRYTGQHSVAVRFCLEGKPLHNFSLEDNLSVLETVRRVQHNAETAKGAQLSTAAPDGQLSFQYGCSLPHDSQQQTSISASHCSIYYSDTELGGWIEYERKTWPPVLIKSFSMCYQQLLREALSNLNLPIGQLEIVARPEIEILNAWNRTDQYYPHLRVDQLFQQRVEEDPDHAAITFNGKSITYRELSVHASSLAARLRSAGAGPGDLIGICMDRGIEMVSVMLAVFKTGGAYLPIDPAFPPDRIAFMLEDGRPLAVVTQSHLCEKLSFATTHVLCVDSLEAELDLEGAPEIPYPLECCLDDLAYVLYTSGSTGKPKGVQITHRALTNLLTGVIPCLPLEKADIFLATSTISFDISVFEIFAPLIAGAHLVVAPRSTTVSGELLADAIRTSGATLLQATPSGWRILLEAGWQGQPALKMITAGESLDRTLARRLLDRGAALWNLYGPTEATIYATGCKISKNDAKITIGGPLPNYTAYVLDRNRKRVPIGAIGELYIGGVGNARGYLNRPELTAEKFIPDLFNNDAGRLYRTGDLARFWPDGQIELLGRADNQIKLRGYRIELEEIESLLDSHTAVRKSVVKVVELGEGDQRLIAYVVAQNSVAVSDAELREYAQCSLPAYMVPTAFVAVEAFALTPSGKVDRKALPVPPALKLLAASLSPAILLDELELTILNCWESVLNVPHLNLDDNFFEIGGHSLLAVRVFAEISGRLNLKLPVSLLVEAPTPRKLADRIRKIQNSPGGCLVPMQTKGSLPSLYLIHHLFGDVLVYRTLAGCFEAERPVIGVQAPAGLADRSEPCSLESLAAEYVKELLEQQTAGPFHLAGFSSGSLLAFEMACQLTQAGHKVGLLALIDGDIKAPGPPLSRHARYTKIATRKACKIIFKFQDEIKEGPKQFVSKRLRYLRLLWRMRRLESSPTPSKTALTLEQTLLLAENSYRPRPYRGSALLLRFHDEAWKFGPDPLMGWTNLMEAGLEVVDFPGGHITGMGPMRASRLASVLRTRMEKAEAAALVS